MTFITTINERCFLKRQAGAVTIMQTLHDLAFDSPNPPIDITVSGNLSDPAYNISIYDVNWTEPGEGVFSPHEFCFIERQYYPIKHLKGAYSSQYKQDNPRTLGNITLIPPQTSLRTHWTTGRQKTLSCMFNLEKMGLIGCFDWHWSNIDLRDTIDINNDYIETLLLRLAEETAHPSFASKIQVDCLLTLIALEIRRHFPELGSDDEALNKHKLSHNQINTLKQLIESATGSEPSLNELAQACDLSTRQLSASFKATTGMTLRSFASETRIKKAKLLLMDKSLLIKEVAYLSGFTNSAAFTAAFRRTVGLTPQQFRDSGYSPQTI